MANNGLPLIEGTGVRIIPGTDGKGKRRSRPNAADVQAAIDQAGAAYRRIFERAPSHVALPSNNTIALDALKLWTLNLARSAGPGVVIVGRPVRNTNGAGAGPAEARQLELL